MRVTVVASLAGLALSALIGGAFAQDGPPAAATPAPCAPGVGTFDFEGDLQGAWTDDIMALSLRNPVVDPARATCGRSSVRMDAEFNSEGDATLTHQRPYEVGELMVKVGGPDGVRDFTGMTVEAAVSFDGPGNVYPRARIFLVSDAGWVPGDASLLSAGRWTVLRHAFGELNPSGEGESLRVNHTFKIVVFVECPGCSAWQGHMNVDAIRWYPTAGGMPASATPTKSTSRPRSRPRARQIRP